MSDPSTSAGDTGEPAEVDDVTDRRGEPEDPADLYLEEANLYRPIVTGDIFRDVPVPAASDDEQALNLTLIVAHPSGMRTRRGALVERVRAASIVHRANLNSTQIVPAGFYDYFQLPLLAQIAAGNGFGDIDEPPKGSGWGARLDVAAPIASSQLNLANRVACLSDVGVRFLIQWLGHCDTRVLVRMHRIKEQIDPKLMEIEWLETWNDELVRPLDKEGEALATALEQAAADFDDLMRDQDSGISLAEMLAAGCDETVDGEQRASSLVKAERIMTRERKRRRNALAELPKATPDA